MNLTSFDFFVLVSIEEGTVTLNRSNIARLTNIAATLQYTKLLHACYNQYLKQEDFMSLNANPILQNAFADIISYAQSNQESLRTLFDITNLYRQDISLSSGLIATLSLKRSNFRGRMTDIISFFERVGLKAVAQEAVKMQCEPLSRTSYIKHLQNGFVLASLAGIDDLALDLLEKCMNSEGKTETLLGFYQNISNKSPQERQIYLNYCRTAKGYAQLVAECPLGVVPAELMEELKGLKD